MRFSNRNLSLTARLSDLSLTVLMAPMVFGLLAFHGFAQAAPPQECSVVRVLSDGSFSITVNGEPHMAIPVSKVDELLACPVTLEEAQRLQKLAEEQVENSKSEITRLQERVRLLESKVQGYEREVAGYKNEVNDFEAVVKTKDTRISALEGVRDTYKELVELYEKRDRKGWLSLSGGIGGTSGGDFQDSQPAALFGIGIKRLRVWGFAQESNFGVMVGAEFPIF